MSQYDAVRGVNETLRLFTPLVGNFSNKSRFRETIRPEANRTKREGDWEEEMLLLLPLFFGSMPARIALRTLRIELEISLLDQDIDWLRRYRKIIIPMDAADVEMAMDLRAAKENAGVSASELGFRKRLELFHSIHEEMLRFRAMRALREKERFVLDLGFACLNKITKHIIK